MLLVAGGEVEDTTWVFKVGDLEVSTAITNCLASLAKFANGNFILLAANKFLTVSLFFNGGAWRMVAFPTVLKTGWLIGFGLISIWERKILGTDDGLLGALNENMFEFGLLTQTTLGTMLLPGVGVVTVDEVTEGKIVVTLLELALDVVEPVVDSSPSFSRANNLLP